MARGDFPASGAGWAAARVKVAEAILQRTGYPAAVKVAPSDTTSAADHPDYAALSMAELIEHQRRILERSA